VRHILGICVLFVLAIAVASSSLGAPPPTATPPALAEAYAKLPLSFEANAGQVSPKVDFLCRGAGMTLFLSGGEAVLSVRGAGDSQAVVRMQPIGSAQHPHAIGLAPQITRTNYFIGNDPKQWHTNIPNYGQVRYRGVYPGIDLIFRGNERRIEYDLVIAPKADPSQIRFAISGADSVEINPQGLILHTAAGDVVQPAPTVYQEGANGRERVEGHYVLAVAPDSNPTERNARAEVGFELGSYDRARALVIDPVIVYSTFLGGFERDLVNGIAVDASGNAYVTGGTASTTFPGTAGSPIQPANAGGSFDAFVTKINAAGTAIVYSTFLGGNGNDVGFGIAVDGSGNAYVTGETGSTTFPGTAGSPIQPAKAGAAGSLDAFVTKINAAGTAIVFSTFLGGAGTDLGDGIAVDTGGNAYVTGTTKSATLPGAAGSPIQPANAGGSFDAFVTKINAAGTAIVFSTFLGGSGDDEGSGIAVDGIGNAYVTGLTNSTTFPGVTGSSIQPANAGGTYDAFVTKINTAGTAILYSTFLGGSGDDDGFAIAVDISGNAYVTGVNGSTTLAGGGNNFDAFVTKINATGTAIVYSNLLGGTGFDEGNSIAVDASGNAYVAGLTSSTTFPGVTGSSIQPANAGGTYDAFVTEINAAGTIVYSTFLGGSGTDDGYSIAVDTSGNAYVAGDTNSTTFPGVSGISIQPAKSGSFLAFDGFVTKIGLAALVADLSIIKAPSPPPYGTGLPVAYTLTVNNAGPASAAGVTVTDVIPAGTAFVSATPSQGSCSGTITVTCALGTIASGGTATISLVLTLPSTPGPVSNMSTVTSSNPDTNLANNSATAMITVIPAAQVPARSPLALLLLASMIALLGMMRLRS